MIILLMGVAGAGKTTVGKLLAKELGWEFLDADDYHSRENVEKMSRNTPLNDEDRAPWLQRMNELMVHVEQSGRNAVVACSALKRSYRQILQAGVEDLRIVYLKGEYELLRKRLQHRKKHYMKDTMLQSQFDTLEVPEGVVSLDVDAEPEVIVRQIRGFLKLQNT